MQRKLSKFEHIALDLMDQIRRGDLNPGDRLPTVAELKIQYQCGQETIFKAKRILRTKGLIYSLSGSFPTRDGSPKGGTYVDDLAPYFV